MSITLIIIILTAAVSIPAFSNPSLFYRLDFAPFRIEGSKEWYRFISHALVHADWMHLIFNMLVLYFFGDVTQSYFEAYAGTRGTFYFILLYLGGAIVATVPTYQKQKHNPNYHSVGASGAVSAVLFSSVMFNPANWICLWGILCLPGIIWAVVYLIYSYRQAKTAKDHINHDAHFWGAVFGAAYTLLTVPASIPYFFEQLWSILPF